MDIQRHEVAEQAKELGFAVLKNTLRLTFSFYAEDVRSWHYLSVLQAAQAAELFIKARIAEEDPEKIYVPKSDSRTIGYKELPTTLFKTITYKISNQELYCSFGKLRNDIQHLLIPGGYNLKQETTRFIFEVIDPVINDFWGLNVLNYIDKDVDDLDKFIFTDLLKANIKFRVTDSYKNRFEDVVQDLKTIIDVADFIKSYNQDLEILEKIANSVINEVQEKFKISDRENATRLCREAIDMLEDNINYQKWGVNSR